MIRLAWLGLAGLTILAGLGSRAIDLPSWEHGHLGDALYAVLIYTLAGVLAPAAPPARRAVGALTVCAAIELSQAWHPAWLDELRSHRLVALVLGRGFLWEDLIAYGFGVGAATLVDRGITRR